MGAFFCEITLASTSPIFVPASVPSAQARDGWRKENVIRKSF